MGLVAFLLTNSLSSAADLRDQVIEFVGSAAFQEAFKVNDVRTLTIQKCTIECSEKNCSPVCFGFSTKHKIVVTEVTDKKAIWKDGDISYDITKDFFDSIQGQLAVHDIDHMAEILDVEGSVSYDSLKAKDFVLDGGGKIKKVPAIAVTGSFTTDQGIVVPFSMMIGKAAPALAQNLQFTVMGKVWHKTLSLE